ncbi:MAG: non-ribosomal peptide synthase/polyketide synthase [Thermoanaerobaculia bacterium]
MSNDVVGGGAVALAEDREEIPGRSSLLHQAFEARAAAEPGAVVLVAGEKSVTFGELEARANQWARYLVEQGVGPEVRVAICAERTVEMVVAMYAVLKAGGAYVPVDPAYPEERQANILADSGALLLLTQEHLAPRIPVTSAKTVFLDRERPRAELHSPEPLPPRADEDNLAYVIYTSGSTGRPKGVAIAHRSAVVLTRWAARVYSPRELSGVLASTSICFDMSIFELFVAPALGGRAILAENALSLPALPASVEVTLVNTVPSAIAELARSGGIPPSVITVNLGGEALRRALVERLYALGTIGKVYNVYGPSEDTTFSTWALVEPGEGRPVSIGHLLDGTWGHLLDPGMERVPGGEPGELYLGGEGLARGYLGRPDLTAERFVPDPFAARPGERVYATGDLIRYRPDGELDYLGRIDHQVKIRGFRVELGEIEATLERHPSVGDTVVVAIDMAGDAEAADKVLVAYVVPKRGMELEVPVLREHLRERLAAYMVPAYFMVLEALPLNPNGKVDRNALPKPEVASERPRILAPRTPLEAALAGIWAEVLGLPEVGVDEDFFALGGHSLLAARVIAQVRAVLGKDLSHRALFEAPSVEKLSAWLEGTEETALAGIVPAPPDRRLEVSPGQRAMWFSDRVAAGLPVYNIPLLFILRGPLDFARLRTALADVLRRHEILRTVFTEAEGQPALAMAAPSPDPPRIDLSALPPERREGEVERGATALARRAIDLHRGPLLQGFLFALDPGEHRLFAGMHHIVGDDWSTWVLARDLAAFYSGDPLPPLPVRYADYSAWHNDWLMGGEARAQLEFWRERLETAPEALDLPADHPRPAVQSFRGGQATSEVPAAEARALSSLALKSGGTPFMALLAAFETLIHRYSGAEDLVVGTPAANRHRPGTENLIGLFTNTLPLRSRVTASATFREMLATAREVTLEALGRQDFPFNQLVREIRPNRRNDPHSALVQVVIVFQNTPPLPRRLGPGVEMELREYGNGTSKFDLVLYLRREGEGLAATWEYAADLFEAPTIARIAGHFNVLLAAAVASPGQPIGELALLTDAEQRQLLVAWNDTATRERPAALVHELFADWARRTPEALAVSSPWGALRYGELEERANRLARHLRSIGVGPEVRVAVCMDHGPERAVAVLAVLKAGGAYVSLDPDHPRERLAFIVEDARALVILTDSRIADRLPESSAAVILADRDGRDGMAAEPMAEAAVLPENLAYVIYTSGSTGLPKGVEIPHAGLLNLVQWHQSFYSVTPADRATQIANPAFDASVWELWPYLTAGASLHVPDEEVRVSPPALLAWWRAEEITLSFLPTPLAEAVLADGEEPAVRALIVGGDRLHARPPENAGFRLVNHYGPSEYSVVTTAAPVPAAGEGLPPIGRPIDNTRVYVLDRSGHPVPAGVPGELYVAGVGLARGYLARPDLTAEQFVPDPWSAEPGARLYRTGDLVRWLADGQLDFVGRIDHQVKIRGFRIELGEIEAALRRHPAVRDAAVAVREGAAGSRRLAAFVAAGDEVRAEDLRAFLAERLPDYMVPPVVSLVASLPLSANGKLDRRALESLPLPEAAEAEAGAAPRSPIEGEIARAWREILGIGAFGVHANFFELGGHSLLATQAISRLRSLFGVEVFLRDFFEQPTVAALARIVEERLQGGAAPAFPAIVPAPPAERMPLSFAQQRLWFLDQMAPGSPAYNVPLAYRLRGPLAADRLAEALAGVVRRHAALRTTFAATAGEPYQAVHAADGSQLTEIDAAELSSEELARRISDEAERPFDLGAGPLLRATLWRLGETDHVLQVVLHHIVFDGWSQGILLSELAAGYEGRPLPPLPVQYQDFAFWQRRELAGLLDEQLAVWKARLADAPQVLSLPTDHPRPAEQSFRGETIETEFPPELARAVRALALRHRATPFMLFLAVFEALLERYTGQADFLVGSPVAGRNRPEIEGLIGFFVNTLVLRAELPGAPDFLGLLERVRQGALEAYAHQDLPFERLVEELRPERDPAYSPLFQVMLAVESVAAGHAFESLSFEPVEVRRHSAKFDLTLTFVESGEGLSAMVEYATDLFEAATVHRLLGHVGRLLEEIVIDPERGWRDLPLLTEAERLQLLAGFNDTGRTSGPEACLHELFEAQALRVPDQVALVDPDGVRLTYRELNERADLLARRLRSLGLGPERLAGVLMDRKADLIVTLLAVLKAGGAYAPLDPKYPKDRILLMLEASRAAVLVTRGEIAAAFTDELPAGLRTVFLDAGWEGEAIAEPVDAPPPLLPITDNLAYVIFTSGSTGVPKAVAIQHRSAVAMIRWARTVYSPAEYAGLLASTSISFDMSVFEVFGALAEGGRIVLAENALALPDLAARDEVVLVDTVPSAMAELLRNSRLPSSIRTVNLGGEPLKGSLVKEIYEKLPNVERVVNLYGPSEDTTFSTYSVVPRGADHPLIGRPLTGTLTYVLDAEMRPAPLGVPGALYLGGEGVTRGYLHRPELTAERFIPDPYGPPGSRLYRVGDLARYLPTGELDFLGRLDHQVKVRGFRIELGEIESALTRHPDLRDAAVLAVPEEGGAGNRLIAYVETDQDSTGFAGEVRAFLKRTLPDYMVPSAFVALAALPLTPNGKIDRRALAGITPDQPAGSVEGEAPREGMEEMLAGIWADVLHLRSVGPHDNFFELGGHSLLGVRMLARIREQLGLELTIGVLFQATTLRALAERIAEMIREEQPAPPPPLQRAPRGGLLPVSYVQESLWYIHLLDPESHVYNVPLAWRLSGPLDIAALEASLDAVWRRHEILRARFVDVEGEPFQEIPASVPFALSRIDLSGLPADGRETELERLIRQEAGEPFDLRRGPLLRGRLAVLSPGDHALLLTAHHAAFDALSQDILTREAAALYAGAVEGSAPLLPELPVQYADFAAWQRSWLEGPVTARLLAWWREELRGAPTVLDLPTDRPRPPVQTFRGAWEELAVPADAARKVLGLGRREGATPFMTLLGLFQALLHRLTGQDDLLLGSPVANRPRPELDGLIGYFVDTVVVRSRFHGEDTFARRLARVREAALGAFSHQHLPFGILAAALHGERDPSRNPLFQVLFAFDSQPERLALAGLAARPLPTGEPAAKLDLSLGVMETDDGLRVHLEYNLDLFDPVTASRFLERFSALIEAVAADPSQRRDAVPLLTAAELRELLAEADRTLSMVAGTRRLLHEAFVDQARRAPEGTAILTLDGERLTYGELDRRSDALAGFLIERGVGPEVAVGVSAERSPELVIAFLGILKAGGVYLPLDPAYPEDRRGFMLEDSGASMVLTRAGIAAIAEAPLAGPPAGPRALPESLAYLIYTSGSTGRPKGVGVPHGAAAAHVEAAAGLFGLDERDRMLWFASPSFDVSMEEVLTPLARGAALVIREAELWSPAELLERIAQLGITVLDLPTAYWHHWAADCEHEKPPRGLALRRVILGGEAMSGEAARRWWRSPLAGIPLINAYGPTETVVSCTALEVDPAVADSAGGTVAIGHPLAGRSAWVLDRYGHGVPDGIAGELCMGGPLLARGYRGRPDVTAERFVPDPFAAEPGARLYRTGDLARRRPDGVLEFLGRVDRQLKVRGFRIEPGEVESALARHPGVGEVAVDARPDQGGEPRLVAWIVPAATDGPADFGDFLRATLPGYMVPSAFVTIDALPLTPNGKVDLRALPMPVITGPDDLGPVVPPHDPIEARLTVLWQDLLGVPQVGVKDSFFALGGHSLLGTRLISRVREHFGVDIPLRALFAAPTVEGMAALLGEALRRHDHHAERPERPPLSFSQQSLWLVERLQPAGGAYNLPTALRLGGGLDVHALKAALGGLVLRHEALRTRFAEADGTPWQEVLPPYLPDLPVIDLGALAEDRREAEARRLIQEEFERPFDLEAGPLLRARLFRLAPGDHVFLLTVHHAVSDGWSEDVVLQDLGALYGLAIQGWPAELPPLPLQLADYAVWQRDHLRGEELEGLLAVWRRRLAGVPPLDLPADRRRPKIWTFRGGTRQSIPTGVSADDLKLLSRGHDATPFMVLLAALQVLLGRYSGQEDFAVGTASANRARSDFEHVVGFFVNMLPLRADLSGAPTFRQLLARVRATALEAFSHQDLPFERLVEDLAPERDLGRNPIFQVILQFVFAEDFSFAGLPTQRYELAGDTAKFDLSFAVQQHAGGLAFFCEYAADLFEGTTVARLLDQLDVLLASAFARPDAAIADLQLLTAGERQQLLAGFNDTGSTAGPEVCLHELFEAQVQRVPDRVALVDPAGVRLTYGELNARADLLAWRLRSLGLGPERLAGVLMDRTADLIVTLLAILKAGGAYAPLDPNYPRERVLRMLEASRAAVLVTRRNIAEAFGDELPEGIRKVFLEAGWESEPFPAAAEALPPLPDNLAYVIFTSGSTGLPKAVAIQHRSAVAMIRWARTVYAPEEYAGLLASTSICFDMSVFEVFGTLAEGGKVVLAENALALPELAARDEVVLIDTVPSAMAELLRMGNLPPSIRTVNLGGEALKGSLVREIYGKLPNVERVVNLYGPSEDTTFSTWSVVPRAADHPLIGRPLTGTSAYVLDAAMQPAPLGVPGALHLGGEGVTRGYLHRPDLTAERFIPNPYGPPGSRLYQVGDLARYLPSGELDFLGRLDHQVKVRGFRIELGEIEAALTRHGQVREAAVLALPEEGGGNRLIAYVAMAEEPAAGELRAFLKRTLPDYMVPSAFVTLPELPLTPNGKIDRRALAALPLQAEGRPEEGRAPQTYAETVLAGLWSDLFGRPVGVDDDFFDLGGHSLLATRLISRLRESLGVDVPMRQLFEQPTLAGFAASLETALGIAPHPAAAHVHEVSHGRPLSFAQRRLWFLDQLAPGSAVYNIPCPLAIEGKLDAAVLAGALSEIVRRHEALRTTFPSADGEPCQEIAPAGPLALPVIDLGGLAEEARHAEAVSLTRSEAKRPFHLVEGPLLRASLLRLGEEGHRLLLTMHHIVSDGWSIEILLRELAALYEAFAAGLPSPLPELPMQYVDFAVWQRQWLSGEVLSRQLDFWRGQLEGAPSGLDLPADFPRPALQTYNGAHRSAALPAALAGELRELCRREGVTLYMLLLAAFDVLLARASGQEDVLVGSPFANRSRAETENLIGFFVNTLVLRAKLSAASSFRSLLGQVREVLLDAYERRDLPFEMLVDALRPERDLSRSPLFQVLLSVQASHEAPPSPAGLKLSPIEEESTGTAKFELSLGVVDRGTDLLIEAEYNTDLFAGGTVGRMLGHLGRLLEEIVIDPERDWRDLPLLTAAERGQLLAGFNDTGVTEGPEACLHELFEEQARRAPDRVALVDPAGVRLTYGELNRRADRLAQRLRSLGLGPEALAGVLMDRTADLIVALLAVLKAGGGYAPLDPKYPRSRVLLMLETSRAAVLVTRREIAEAFGDELPGGIRTVFLDAGWEGEPAAEAVEPARVLPGNLAYIIFTSGSTGIPKGVAIQHRSAVAMIRWARTMYTPEEYAGLLASTSICFDMSVFEIFGTLAEGGKILLADNALALPELAARDEVVLVDTVPSAMAELLRLGGLPPSIRTVNLGGEPLKGSLVREIYRKLPGVERVVNLYGPSEETTFSTWSVVPRDAEHPLIGRPLTGAAAYVLDERMQPVPLGVRGALYLGGEGVTRGYLGRPDLTAERFIPNPYGPPGSRLYQVGDLVRYLPTGELDFLGRLDTQVKVRGFRIELGEIESALTRHPEVLDAAVLALPEADGGNRLIAYVETAAGPVAGELRAFLKTTLPDYMIPSAFVLLPALPLTPNGKIDRRALAVLPLEAPSATDEGRAPRGYAEEVLAGIWSEVFGHPAGVDDDFFDLGGHSLLATRVMSRVREAFGLDVPVRRLFELPTIAGLAASLEASLGVGRGPEEERIEPVPRTGPLPLSFAQRRLWLLDQLSPGSAVYNIPVPLSVEGNLDVPVLRGALDELVRRHESLRTTFPSVEGQPRQAIAPAAPFPLPVVDLRGVPEPSRGAEPLALAARDAARPFDLETGPLFRAALLRLAPESHVLLLAMHHIVSDGWSMDVLLRELATLYDALAEGRPSPLPEPPIQYADFAVWQRRWLEAGALASQLDYWRRQLAGAPSGLDLPTDFARPAVQTFNGAACSAELPAALSADLHAFCRREGVTPFMLLLTAFDVLMARYSGQRDVLVGSPIANRNRAETEGLIGFFVNTLVFRAGLDSAPSFAALLHQVRETALAAYGNQDVPFETLVEELRPERDLSRSPFFQVLLSVQTGEAEPPSPRGLRLSVLDGENATAKFDLSLFALDSEPAFSLAVEYNTDLFEAATARRLLGHAGRLLEGALTDPHRGWRDLPLLTAPEREQLLTGFNDTGATSGPEACLHELFEYQVERVPDRIALAAPEGVRLTYRELNARADLLARRLRALGLGPEVLAGVLMDRTADLIVALLAVLKAGGGYAPLDPKYPKQRVLLMLETSRAPVLVTRRAIVESFAGELPAGIRTVYLDAGWEDQPAAESGEGLRPLPDNLSYIIFTSGSTGIPKGVAIQHRSAVAMIRWARAMYTPEEYAGLLASTSICFDMSVFEIFGTLAEGGKILLADNALALPELAARDEVVLVDTVPSAMAELLRLGGLPPSIRTVNLGGEALKGSLVREIYEQLPAVERVVNLYGPSEDTTFSTYSVAPRGGGHPLIGRPLTGTLTYVLDAGMQPVPLGIPGALYLGGEGVTRGYLGRPDLTAERFIPNPYGPPGSRLYQVGDLVRYLPTGELDFLGRLDHQVKVRGFRIELGEVESALTRHPEVREAAVLAVPEEGGGNRLIAFVATAGETAGLRAFLKGSLPDYMVPSAFVALPEMPLTPNGKIDRRALAALPLEDTAPAAEGRAPRGYVEEVLVGLWSEAFDRPVGVEDNFFDLGGHSLLATRVAARIRSVLNVELPLQRLFAAPTVEALAALIERDLADRRSVPLPPIQRASREGLLPLSFAQQRLWFLDRLEPGTATFNLPSPLRLAGPLDASALSRTLDEIARRHESLRTVFGEREGRGYQEVRPPAPVPLPRIDLSGLPAPLREAEALKQSNEEARLPFDLVRGPLFRTALVRLAPDDHVLLATLHHIVTDGISMDVFARELWLIYEAFAAGLPSPLPELPLQYPDFAAWQREALSGPAVEALLEQWKGRFGAEIPPLRLPTDRPRPPVQTYPGGVRSLQISAETSREIRNLARRSGVTMFMALLGAFQALLHRYTGQDRIVVGSPVAGRNHPELEGLIGFFVNTLVLPGDVSDGLTVTQLLERSREMALGAYAAQDLPFERLVEALQPVRDKSRGPLFQVMFLMHHQDPAAPAGDGGLRIAPFEADTGTSQFDLTLFAADGPEGILTGVEYNTDLFDAATMDRLLEQFRDLLARAAADPAARLGDILPAAPERRFEEPSPAEKPTAPAVDERRDRLASRLSKLTPAQREALEKRLKGGGS